MRPVDIPTTETVAFLARHSPAGATVLEVGCGDGAVAAAMMDRGLRVIGVDADPQAVVQAQGRGVSATWARWPSFERQDMECHDFQRHDVDVVAFTRSLHHISPLYGAIRKARELLTNPGVILVEDFAFDAANDPTITWFVKTLRSAMDLGLTRRVPGELATDLLEMENPKVAWQESHHADLHTIATMNRAIAAEFVVQEHGAVPYLYRYLVPVLPETQAAAEFLKGVFDDEAHRGRQGEIELIGRRIAASR